MSLFRDKIISLLRWSERYTKTDMVYLTSGGFWLVIGHVLQIVSGIILAVAFANLVPKNTFGTYQFVMSVAAVLSAFTLTGMSAAVMRAVARGSTGALRAGVRAQLQWSVAMVLAGAALAAYYFLKGNTTLSLSFLIAGSFSPFISAFGLSRSFFIGRQLFRESATFGFTRKVLPVAALVATVFATHDVVTIVFVYFASNALASALLYWQVLRTYKLPRSHDEEMVGYSKHLSAINIFSEIAGQADKVLIFHFLGAAPVAAYALAQLPVTHMRGLFKHVSTMTLPKLSVAEFPALKATLPYKVRVFLFATLAAVVLYALAAPYFFALLFPAYPESVLLSQVLALTLLSVPRGLYGQALTAHKKKRALYITNISHNTLKLILLIVLLPLYGVWGAVAAILVSQLYFTLVTRYYFLRS